MGRTADRQLVEAHDTVQRDVFTDPHHIVRALISQLDVEIGDASAEVFRI